MPGGGVSGCLWLATAPPAQAGYASAIFVAVIIDVIIILAWDPDSTDGQDGLRLMALLTAIFGVYLPGFVMMVARLCMPIVWVSEMMDVPPCCPCTCFPHLDTPWYVALGCGACDVLFVVLFAANAWLLGVAYFSMEIAAAVCAIVKLCIMLDCCCSECKPRSAAGQVPTAAAGVTGGYAGGPVVVGQPVSSATTPAQTGKGGNE